MGSTSEENFSGVVIVDDLDNEKLVALEWAFENLDKFMKKSTLIIIHVVSTEKKDKYSSATNHVNRTGLVKHFENGVNGDLFTELENVVKLCKEDITLKIFKGDNILGTLQDAINKDESLRRLKMLVLLGLPKREDGAEPQKISGEPGCIVIVVPKKDESVTIDLAPAVAERQAPSESAATPPPLENHSRSGEGGGSVPSLVPRTRIETPIDGGDSVTVPEPRSNHHSDNNRRRSSEGGESSVSSRETGVESPRDGEGSGTSRNATKNKKKHVQGKNKGQ